MVKTNKRRGFNKDDLMKLIAYVDENIKVYYKSGVATRWDLCTPAKGYELLKFLWKHGYSQTMDPIPNKSERVLIILYKDGMYEITDCFKKCHITVSSSCKENLHDVRRFLLADKNVTDTICQICCRDVVHFKEKHIFHNFYHVCDRCSFFCCIECRYTLTKSDHKRLQCPCCKKEHNDIEWFFWEDEHSNFVKGLHYIMKRILEEQWISKEEFDKWVSIHEENRL